jgi:hypothetical protein
LGGPITHFIKYDDRKIPNKLRAHIEDYSNSASNGPYYFNIRGILNGKAGRFVDLQLLTCDLHPEDLEELTLLNSTDSITSQDISVIAPLVNGYGRINYYTSKNGVKKYT